MASPQYVILLSLLASCSAGPLGPLPNVTSVDLGLKEGSCALGDVVYMPGDEFPGAAPCERCSCTDGSVQCAKQRCEPRPGCKAVHRPDHCCPTYQCECEQEGRVYDNGEKLVDPQDPCKVCYCQGGEVVCRRIACFVRDDCKPRLVPGRCCPEYDNCPLRGVTTLPGVSPSIPSTVAVDTVESVALPSPPQEPVKPQTNQQQITIKEITPVSEIPVITGVKIKEILPSSTMDVAEYSSSKSPLITREATSEKSVTDGGLKTEAPSVVESLISSPSEISSSSSSIAETKNSNDPSKISLSTQDSLNSEMFPLNIGSIVTLGSPSVIADVPPAVLTTKAPPMEEEDLSAIDHNPLFPPIPDDLTSNHEEEQNLDSEHIMDVHEVVSVSSPPTSTEGVAIKELLTTTFHYVTDAASLPPQDISSELSTSKENLITTESSEKTSSRENSMINLRSAIPTEILNVPTFTADEITGETDESTGIPVTEIDFVGNSSPEIIITTDSVEKNEESSPIPDLNADTDFITSTETDVPFSDATYRPDQDVDHVTSSQESQDQTTNSISKSNVATEITSQTELSSIPIETSDQNPHDASEKLSKDKTSSLTSDPALLDSSTTKLLPVSSEVITVSRAIDGDNDDQSFENVETTEFILTSYGSSESTTEAVELIKISPDSGKSAPIIDPHNNKNSNVLTDLINLVGDVASISDHTDADHPVTGRTTISDSEELLPVNAGYKSKNNNWNQNSITEVPFKNKQPVGNKQKVVEIEDEDTDSITDSPPPHDKVEPTTRRPIIDNVSDDMPANKTEKSGKKDIEIITQSYVPTISRRPTKVVMKKNNEKPISEEIASEVVTTSPDVPTENNVNLASVTTVAPVFNSSSSEAEESIVEETSDTTTPAQ